ncbi:MAG: hypothetical protein FWH38_07675, partial [Treponema sp.]|nr:hypothetical protein [Treponema sp.]
QERRPPPKAPPPPADEETVSEGEDDPGGAEEEAAAQEAPAPAERVWYFEDLVLEEARGREEENREIRHRFDFPPYERFF